MAGVAGRGLTRPCGSGYIVRFMRAGQAASAAGVSVKALRYYERVDLVHPSRAGNGYRVYTDADVRAVLEIRALMDLGLSAREAEPFIACLRAGHEAADECADSMAAYQRKIEQMDAMIARMNRARAELAQRLVVAARRGFDDLMPPDTTTEEIVTLPRPEPLPDGLIAPDDDGAADHRACPVAGGDRRDPGVLGPGHTGPVGVVRLPAHGGTGGRRSPRVG